MKLATLSQAFSRATAALLAAETVDRLAVLLTAIHDRHAQGTFNEVEYAALTAVAGALIERIQAADTEPDPFGHPAVVREDAQRAEKKAGAASPSPAGERREYGIAPAGETTVEVRKAEIGSLPWNDAEHLRLQLSAGREYGFIFGDVPFDREKLMGLVARCLGFDNTAALRANPGDAVGRELPVVLKHIERRNGSTAAVIDKWLPAAKGEKKSPLVDHNDPPLDEPASTPDLGRGAPQGQIKIRYSGAEVAGPPDDDGFGDVPF
jgi:hypothetical protein